MYFLGCFGLGSITLFVIFCFFTDDLYFNFTFDYSGLLLRLLIGFDDYGLFVL